MGLKSIRQQIANSPAFGMPLLGRVTKGAERTEEDLKKNRPGKDLTHFRPVFAEQYKAAEVVWRRLYGDEPRELTGIQLIGQTPDEAFSMWKEQWSRTKLIRRCDEENQVRYHTPQGYRNIPIPCAAPNCECNWVGRLSLLIPELIRQSGHFGYMLLQTHSRYDLSTIYGYLTQMYNIFGTLRGIPFTIGRQLMEVPAPKPNSTTGEKILTKKWLIYMTLDEQFGKAHLIGAITNQARTALLTAGVGVDPQTGEIALPPAISNLLPPRSTVATDLPSMDDENEDTELSADEEEEDGLGDLIEIRAIKVTKGGKGQPLVVADALRYTSPNDDPTHVTVPILERYHAKFESMGYDVSDWKTIGAVQEFDPTIDIYAHQEDWTEGKQTFKVWVVNRVEAPIPF